MTSAPFPLLECMTTRGAPYGSSRGKTGVDVAGSVVGFSSDLLSYETP